MFVRNLGECFRRKPLRFNAERSDSPKSWYSRMKHGKMLYGDAGLGPLTSLNVCFNRKGVVSRISNIQTSEDAAF
jgi:hypothetical protein